MDMIDREKVTKGLEHCCNEPDCRGCVYFDEILETRHKCSCVKDALTLLKEQEPIIPDKDGLGYYYCGACGCQFRGATNFCPKCGKAVKWNG